MNSLLSHRLMIVIWNMGIGGVQKRVRDVISDISAHHPLWHVYLIVRGHKDKEFSIGKKKNVTVLYYPFQGPFRLPFGFIVWLVYLYATIRPAVVLTFLAQLSIVMLFIRRLVFFVRSRIVLNEGAFTTRYLELNGLTYLQPFIRHFYRWADAIIVPTAATASELTNRYCVSRNTIHVIPNWTLYSPSGSSKKPYDLLYVGRYEPEKNPLLFLTVIRSLARKNISIAAAMIGSGSLAGRLQQQAATHSSTRNITFFSFREDVSDIIKQSKILLVPSYNEGMPNVVLEAAMCGVPTVANRFMGSEEVIIDGITGHITGSEAEMADRIRRLIFHPRMRLAMGMRARHHVRTLFHRKRQQEFIAVLFQERENRGLSVHGGLLQG